ncbi:MAG: GNAT family N-acetyltransferase [Rhizobiales bacterium]|nr:GNAT family N-acetyltransferase [Hyphomicrobiales bacterium]
MYNNLKTVSSESYNNQSQPQSIGQSETNENLGELFSEVISFNKHVNIKEHWLELVEKALEPNPFYSPDYLCALVDHIASNDSNHLVLIWSDQNRKELLGLYPVTKKGKKNGYPFQFTCFLFDDLIGICTPLISPQAPSEIWHSFFKAIEKKNELSNIIYIPEFYIDGPTGQSLNAYLKAERKINFHRKEFKRAVALPGHSTDLKTYIKGWSSKKKRNMRSRKKKLIALGELTFEILASTDPGYKSALANVLELEKKGWKGQQRTALLSQATTKKFAENAFKPNVTSPHINLALMRLNNHIIAGQINLISQNCAFFIKSAYDESLSSFGPGLILYKWVLQKMLDENCYIELDSCANANHVLEDIWLERKKVQDVMIAPETKGYEMRLKSLSIWMKTTELMKRNIKRLIERV